MKAKVTPISLALLIGLTSCATTVVPSQTSRTAHPSQPIKPGGTIYVLTENEQWDQIDPQRVYTPEDLAFFGSTIYRSLEGYAYSADTRAATSLIPDLATDLGSHNASATQWSFTLRDGVTWQDGSPITCQDVKYGVSRTFATDVINQGPTYAIAILDIPYEADGKTSRYKGPYSGVGQALFDKAVTCDGKTITFNLNRPVLDFNYTVTIGFFPVPKAADAGGLYGQPGHVAASSGPYEVRSYSTGKGGRFVLVRNPHWNPSSDPIRKAYPDEWEVDFALDGKVIDQRLMASAGSDASAIGYGPIQPDDRAEIFANPDQPNPPFAGRAVNGFDPYARYLWVNVPRVPDVNIRRAMWVALDRAGLRNMMGGAFAGQYADGVIEPTLSQDYAPTGLLDGTLDWLQGRTIPDTGDPAFAKQLISEASNKTLSLSFLFPESPTGARTAAIVKASLERAGFTIVLAPECSFYSPTCDAKNRDLGIGGWGADWPNGSTVIPPLFAGDGYWNMSQLHDAAFDAKIVAAQEELDRSRQTTKWQALNRDVVENMYVLPTFFGFSQTLAGARVGGVYRWPVHSSWPYGAMYVKD
jgi:peptide/nickel transport system substrate-binding protein